MPLVRFLSQLFYLDKHKYYSLRYISQAQTSCFALGVYLLQKTGSTSSYSFLLLVAFLPAVMLAPAGGVIVDRKDRKQMMAVADPGSSLGIFTDKVQHTYRPEHLYADIHCGGTVGDPGRRTLNWKMRKRERR